MKDLKGYLYKKEKVLELYQGEKKIHEQILHDLEDEWFGCQINKEEFDFNIVNGNSLGMYQAEKVGKNTYRTSDFLDQILLEIC